MRDKKYYCIVLFLVFASFISAGCVSLPPYLPAEEEAKLAREIRTILQGIPDQPEVSLEGIVSESGFIWPIKGTILEPQDPSWINIKAREGASIRAVKSGIVTFVSDDVAGCGKTATIKHSDGFLSFYAYNSEILVKKNQVVKQGDVIAKAGTTGRATTSQLHFRLFKNDIPVNPLNYLP
jgi:murein DD-endopeptidase MepM/ murein hydrolase activator NlpD